MPTYTRLLLLFFAFLQLLLLSGVCYSQGLVEEQIPALPIAEEGKLIIKVKKGYAAAFTPESVENRFKAVGIKKCNAGFDKIIQASRKGGAAKLKEDRFGVSRIYEVEVENGVSTLNLTGYFKAMEWVEYAEPVYKNYLLAPPFVPNDPYLVNQWQHTNIDTYGAWGINQGSTSVVIGIIDTGVNHNHPDLVTQAYFNNVERFGLPGIDDDGNGFVDDSLGYDFGDLDPVAMDPHFHGTAVTGMAAARANNAEGVAGAGFNVSFMPLKVMNSGGAITRIMNAVLYGAENGCHILNLSLGRIGGYLQWEQDIFNYVVLDLDVAVVSAAGNTNGEFDFYPASYMNVLSVAHSLSTDNRVTSGTYSTNVDLMAPGGGVWTTYNFNFAPYYYYPMTGSSFASPLTAGVVGLVRAQYPELDARQAMQLVRVTSDNVYSLAGNAPFREKLGYGRLNAYRALEERPVAKAARMTSFSARNSVGDFIFPGDTVEIVCDFTNHLQPLSSVFRVTLRSTSPHVTVIDSVFNAGAMATNAITNNNLQKYRVVVSSAVPRDHLAKMRLGYSDVGYADYQYFVLNCNMSFINLNINDLSMTIGNNATIGYFDRFYLNGIGVRRYGTEVLREAGLMIGRDSVRFSDAVIRSFGSNIREENFKFTPHPSGLANPRIIHNSPLLLSAETFFTDTLANPNAVGVYVKQTVTGRRNSPHRKYVIFEYEIQNITTSSFDSLTVGIFADWNLGNSINLANWDNIGKFGYIYKDTSYVAIKALSTTRYNHFAYDKISSSASGNINILDTFTKGEKWRSSSRGLARNFAGTLAGASGNDVAHYVGTSIMNVLPGEKRKVYFALMIGNSLADLRASGDEAQVMVNPSVSPVPVFTDSVFCAGGPYVISPSGGTNFAFYSPWNPTVPLHIGNSFTVPADSASNVYLVTCRDSIVESLPRWISYEIVSPAVNIGAPASIIIPDVPSVALTSLSPTAVAWSWNFGNGFTSNLPNPTTAYHSSGVYTITLTVTDINGCTASTSRNISVVRRSPVPIINPTYHFVCWDEKVVIAPANGTNFRFYRNAALTDFMLQASQLTVTDPLLQNVWVTCIDSLLESSAVQVTIRRSFVRPEFNVSPVFDTIIFASVNFTDLTVSDFGIIQWEWNFGDGTPISTQRNPSHTYNAQGVYEVKLRARNSMGCWGEIRRTFKVGKRSPVPLLTDNSANVCVGDKAFIFPLNGTIFNYYSDAALTNRIFRGKNYEHTVTESSPNVLYITCADSLIESAPRAFRINKFSAFADFEYPREVLIHVSNRANFIDKSRDAVEWEWDFGNGTFSSAKSPTAIYRGQGTFTVKLTIKDSKGCKATVSKKILVVNRSPQPHVPNYKICKNDRVTIAPEGGSVFKFYESEFAPNPVWVGRTYQTPRLHANRTYFITCADSAIESPAARCEVILSRPITNFIMSDDSLNLFRTDTVFFRDRSLYAKRWLWNFGNGRNGFVPNTFSVYKEKKSYTVSLVTFDSLNCLDTMRRVLVVYDSAVVASLDPEDDYDFAVFPVPASEQINIAFSKYGHLPISYRLYSASGQLILETQPHISEKSFESIRTAHLPRGFYVLNVKIGDKDFRRKVILE